MDDGGNEPSVEIGGRMIDVTIGLPYPPSINHYYRYVGSRMLISRGGREYRKRVVGILKSLGTRPMGGPLDVTIDARPPDRRKRDIDNIQKVLLDAIMHGGAFFDDSQIVELTTRKLQPVKNGSVIVCIRQKSAAISEGA